LDNNSYSNFDEIFIPAMALFEGKLYKRALKKIEELIPILQSDKKKIEIISYYIIILKVQY